MLTIIAIRAQTKNIEIGNPTFNVTKEMNGLPRRIREIAVEISFSKKLSDSDKDYLETEAKKCPVALSISPEVKQNITFRYA